LQKRTRSILDELAHMPIGQDRENLVESRATHVISSAINLLSYIKENYNEEQSAELERRLLNSIRNNDPDKFIRGVRRFRNDT
jgi:hypothetical protein